MSPQKFPSYRYHATLEPVIVNSEDGAAELGKEWAESPAAFSKKSAKSSKDDDTPVNKPHDSHK